MSSVFVSPEEFSRLRELYGAWRDAGFPDIDEGMQPILEKLNSIDGVVTLNSCCGHHSTARAMKTPFYVYLALQHTFALNAVNQLFASMATRLVDSLRAYEADAATRAWGMHRPSQNVIHYQDFSLTSNFKDIVFDGGQVFTYCRWAFIAKGTHHAFHRENFLKEFNSALDRLMQNQDD